MLNRGHSQNFQNLTFLHHFAVLLLKEAYFPEGISLKSFQYEMRAIITGSLVHKTFQHSSLWENETHIIMGKLENVKLESTGILEISFFSFISSDSWHKNMLLESLNIPLRSAWVTAFRQLPCLCMFLVQPTWQMIFSVRYCINGSQLAKMKKSIPDMSLP